MDLDTPAIAGSLSDKDDALSGKEGTGKGTEDGKESEAAEDNDYMELYVQKELKDKIEPIDEAIAQQKEDLEALQ